MKQLILDRIDTNCLGGVPKSTNRTPTKSELLEIIEEQRKIIQDFTFDIHRLNVEMNKKYFANIHKIKDLGNRHKAIDLSNDNKQ